MWAFLICSIQELTSGQPVLQQAAAHPIATTFLGLILSIASLAPKYISGVALSELHEAASKDGLPQALRFFNKTHELWLGRVAMLGFVFLTWSKESVDLTHHCLSCSWQFILLFASPVKRRRRKGG